MKTFKCSLVLRTRENTDVFITLDDNIYGIHSKTVNILYMLTPQRKMIIIWAQLFKTKMSLINVSLKLIIKYGMHVNIFAGKNVSSFCICKSYSRFFFSKNTCELDIILTGT